VHAYSLAAAARLGLGDTDGRIAVSLNAPYTNNDLITDDL